jgi:hypothetical protein
MTSKYSPENSGAIQDRLVYLKEKKAVLDELIACLERYALYSMAPRDRQRSFERTESDRRLAGAA